MAQLVAAIGHKDTPIYSTHHKYIHINNATPDFAVYPDTKKGEPN